MTLDEQIKKGGPYTKNEQDERRKQVLDLYYDKNYPIVKIANILNVNRNTISEDVKHWQMQFAEEFENIDLSTWITSHLLRLESQKIRVLEQAEKIEQPQAKLGFEKMAFNIESKIGQVGLEWLKNRRNTTPDVDPEKEIREIVMHLINIKNKKDCLFTEDEILFEILKFKKCDEDEAERFFDQMNDLGLEYSKIENEKNNESEENNEIEVFDIKKFAEIRGYLQQNV